MSPDIDESSENVLYDWSGREQPSAEDSDAAEAGSSWGTATASEPISEDPVGTEEEIEEIEEIEHDEPPAAEAESPVVEEQEEAAGVEPEPIEDDSARDLETVSSEHAPGDLDVPDGYARARRSR